MRHAKNHGLMLIITMALFVLGGCADDITNPAVDAAGDNIKAETSQTNVTDLGGVTWYEGLIGGTNVYALLVPHNWNGELVVYAHG